MTSDRLVRNHLPEAVEFDDASLRELTVERMVFLSIQCDLWSAHTLEFGMSIISVSGKVLWQALIVDEVRLVSEAKLRVQAALRLRRAALYTE
jgi:hypothetical protein